MNEVDWERRLKEALRPEKPEWEKHIEEALKPVDEIERIRRELKEKYGVEQRANPDSPRVPAREWREMENREILASIEAGIRVLRGRTLGPSEKRYAADLAKDLIDIAMDPPAPEIEEEEYEEVLHRARYARGEPLV